ncbi:MAG: M23 family metallopeptidase, partial [Gemmatimonadota bacterium]
LLLLLASFLSPFSTGSGVAGCMLETDLTAYQPGDVAFVLATCDGPPAFFRARLGAVPIPFFPLPGSTPSAAADSTEPRALQPWRMGALVGIDLRADPGTAELGWTARLGPGAAAARGTTFLTLEPRQFATQRLSLPRGMVTPDPASLARIERERRLMHETLGSSVPERLWHGAFVSPIPGAAGGGFGARRVLNGRPSAPHSGMDLRGAEGTGVFASNEGIVVLVDTLYFAGKTVVLDHGLGLFTVYNHLSARSVVPGDRVERGQLIGRVGATGRVTGPHLHWAVHLNGARVDPISLLAATAGRGRHPTELRPDRPTE